MKGDCMVRKCILFGIIVAMFLPAIANAAQKKQKPALMVVVLTEDGPEGAVVPFIGRIAEETFEVRVYGPRSNFRPADLADVEYILISGVFAKNSTFKSMFEHVDKSIMNFKDKALILVKTAGEAAPLKLPNEFSQNFPNIYLLDYEKIGKSGAKIIKDLRSDEFTMLFQKNILCPYLIH